MSDFAREGFVQPEEKCTALSNETLVDVEPVLTSAFPAAGGIGLIDGSVPLFGWNPAGVGESDTREVQFIGPNGLRYPALITMTQTNGGTGGNIASLNATGGIGFSAQNRDMLVLVEVGPDQFGRPFEGRFHMRAGSIATTESLTFTADNPVVEFAQGAGGQNIGGSLPFTGVWHNNNNGAPSGFGFAASNRFTFFKNNTSTAGGGVIISLRDFPEEIEYDACDLPDLMRMAERETRLAAVEAALAEPANPAVPTGMVRIGRYQEAAPIDINGSTVTTGFNLLSEPQLRLKVLLRDNAIGTPWQIGENDVDSMVERFNIGGVPDGRQGPFDNDFVNFEIIDPSTGEIQLSDNGRQFEAAWFELWAVREAAVPAAGDNPIVVKSIGEVNADGTASLIVNATVSSPAAGQYDILFDNPLPAGTQYVVTALQRALANNDDYQIAYLNDDENGFRIEIREQDNGGAPGVLIASGFSFNVQMLGNS